MDDISVAERLAQEYQEAGIDPTHAVNPNDFEEFGGIAAFTGFNTNG